MKYHVLAHGIPKLPHMQGRLKWSSHAQKRAQQRNIKLPKYIDSSKIPVVEYNSTTKRRFFYFGDIVIVVSDTLEIVTVYRHRYQFNIDKTKYAVPIKPKIIRMKK